METPQERRRTLRARPGVLILALMAAFAAGSFWANQSPPRPSASPLAAPSDLNREEIATIDLFRAASPSVVYITSLVRQRSFFNLDVREIPSGTGTGFVWDDEGHIVTNFHVIQRANAAQVTLADHSTWEAEVVGYATDKDLAVLKIDTPRRPPSRPASGLLEGSARRPERLRHRQPLRSGPDV